MATFQLSAACRNAMLDALESTIGTAPILEIRTGSLPANCAAADSGTLLAQMTLPSDWMNAASSGSKTKNGTFEDSSANATGTAEHWRLKDSGGSTVHMQGDISATGGGGSLTLDSVSITASQDIVITAFTISAANS